MTTNIVGIPQSLIFNNSFIGPFLRTELVLFLYFPEIWLRVSYPEG